MIQEKIEKNVLGHLLSYGKRGLTDDVFDIISQVEPEYFTIEKHRILYETIVETIAKSKSLDILVLFSSLQSSGKLQKYISPQYLSELINSRELSTNAKNSVSELISEYKRRTLVVACKTAISKLESETNVEETADFLDKAVYEIHNREQNTMVDILKESNRIIEKANNADRFGCYGYSFGIHLLDYITGGLESGKTYVVGATKKSGKSKFIINTIFSLVQNNVKSLFLSLEMNGEGVVKELISRFAEINNTVLRNKLDGDTETKIKDAVFRIDNVEIDTQTHLNITQLRYKIRMASHRGVKVVFLDYLQRMDFQLKGSNSNFATVVAQTVSQIADIGKEYNVAILFLSQLANRAENEQATIADLKDSGGIAEGVDCIMILNNQDRINKNYDPTQKINEIWITVEQRSGQSGLVKCKVDLSMAKYQEVFNA